MILVLQSIAIGQSLAKHSRGGQKPSVPKKENVTRAWESGGLRNKAAFPEFCPPIKRYI